MSARRRVASVARRAGGLVAGSVMRVRTDEPLVALTYDDGPAEATSALLDALADLGSTATFFLLLTRVRISPGLVADVRDAGHEIALHGPDHRRLTALDPGTLASRMRDARSELEDVAGTPVRWFRPPYGAQSLHSWRAARRAGLEPVLWGPTFADWRDAPDDERLRLALAGDRGAIILAHDGHADELDGVEGDPAPVVDRVALVRGVHAGYRERGLALRSLGEVATSGRLVREARFVR
jgi:peptidoglycan/xylan/chitin deacetylase (PgdA/CDA1 family)